MVSFLRYHMSHVKWKYWHGLLYYTANGFCEVRYFSLILEQKKKAKKQTLCLIYNLGSFVRSKRKKDWTEAKSVKSFNIWVGVQHLEPPLLPLFFSISSKKKPESDLLKVVQCESEKIRYLNARQSWHLSPLKGIFVCDWFQSQKVNTITFHTFQAANKVSLLFLRVGESAGRLLGEIYLLPKKIQTCHSVRN